MEQKILLIDDDASFLGILERWLGDAGYGNVHTASSGAQGLVKLDDSHDLVISDIYLGDVDGISIAGHVREQRYSCGVLLMTGHLTTEVTLQALNHQVNGFLPKPFNRQDFLAKVRAVLAQAAQSKSQSAQERVLAIGAHPDDVEIGCGGILLKHRDAGDEIMVLTLSSGECGGTTTVRSAEAREAAQKLGARLVLGDLEDTRISEGPETIEIISRAVREFQPTLVYTHSLSDAHQDHRNAHRATLVAARSVPRLQCYQSPSSTIEFTPSRFVDISGFLPEKQELISCYRSQRNKCRYLAHSLIDATAEYWGRFAGYAMVEPLEVIRSI